MTSSCGRTRALPRGKRRTVEHHLPEHRRDLRHRSRAYWINKATGIDKEVARLAERIFDSDDVLYQLRKVQAVVTLLEGYPKKRASRAALRALHFGCLEYRSIKNILVKGLDLEPPTRGAGRARVGATVALRSPSDRHRPCSKGEDAWAST